jgi:hypothetical protein
MKLDSVKTRADRTAARRKTKGGTDRGAALVRARLSVRSALSHPTQMTVQFDVRGRTTTASVRKVGLRIDLLREREVERASRTIKISDASRNGRKS